MKRKPPAKQASQASFEFPEPVCRCGCPESGHNRSGTCQRCLECRRFELNPLATFSRAAAIHKRSELG